jgi:hypothetical protein
MSKTLPEELKGKTPEEISAHYEDKLKLQKSTYESALAALDTEEPKTPPVTPPAAPKVTMQDFLNDPAGRTTDLIKEKGVTREEWTAATKVMQDNFIYMAKERAVKELKSAVESSGGKFLWEKFNDQIDKAAKAFEPMALTAVDSWKSVYFYIVGMNNPTVVREEVLAATMPAEVPNAGGNEPPTPVALTKEEKTVAAGLGLSDDSWRKGKSNMATNTFPLVTDNRKMR